MGRGMELPATFMGVGGHFLPSLCNNSEFSEVSQHHSDPASVHRWQDQSRCITNTLVTQVVLIM